MHSYIQPKKGMGLRMRRNPLCHTPHMWALSNEATLTKKSKFCLSTERNQVILRQNLMNDKDLTRSRNWDWFHSSKSVCCNGNDCYWSQCEEAYRWTLNYNPNHLPFPTPSLHQSTINLDKNDYLLKIT